MAVKLQQLTHAEIHPNAHNLRQSVGDITELADSIAGIGLIEPMVVRKNADGYELIAGERRWSAIGKLIDDKILDAGTLWPTIVQTGTTDADVQVSMIVENLHRQGLTPIEEMNGMLALVNAHGWTTAKVAEMTGIPHSTVKNRIKLGVLPQHILDAIAGGKMDLTTAGDLASLKTEARAALLKSKKIPDRWDVQSVSRKAAADVTEAKLTKLLKAKNQLVIAKKDWQAGIKDRSLLPPAIAKKCEEHEALVKDNDALQLDDNYVSSDPKKLEEYLTDVPGGEIFVIDRANTAIYIRHQRVKNVGKRVEQDDSEWTDFDRACELLDAQYDDAMTEWSRAREQAMAHYLAHSKPAELLADILQRSIKTNDWQISQNSEMLQRILGLEKMDSQGLIEWAVKSAPNSAKVIVGLRFTHHAYEVPGFELPKPKRQVPNEADYDEDGRFVGEPKREEFESDEEFAAAQQVYAEHKAFIAERDDEYEEEAVDAEVGDGDADG